MVRHGMKGFHSFLSVSSQKWYLDIKRERDVYVCIFKGGGKHFCMALVKQLDDALGTVCEDGLTGGGRLSLTDAP